MTSYFLALSIYKVLMGGRFLSLYEHVIFGFLNYDKKL